MEQEDLYYNEMPFQMIPDKKKMKDYEEKMIMVKSKKGFTHMFRLIECKEDCIIGIMYTGMMFEPVRIPLENVDSFYAARSDYNKLASH